MNINEKAVSDKNGEVQMNVNTRTSVSSSLYERTNDSYVIFTVKSITLDRVLEFYDIEFVDLIKFDIEGAEDLVFSSFTCWDSVEVIVGEAHYDLMDTSRLEFLNYFEEFDVTVLSKYREDREILQFDHR